MVVGGRSQEKNICCRPVMTKNEEIALRLITWFKFCIQNLFSFSSKQLQRDQLIN